LFSLLTTLKERRQELEKLQEKFEFLQSLQAEEGDEQEVEEEFEEAEEEMEDDLEVMLQRLKLLEAKQDEMQQQKQQSAAVAPTVKVEAPSAVQTELAKLDDLTEGVDKNAETLLRFFRDLQELQAMGADPSRIEPLLQTLSEQMAQLNAHRSKLDTMKAVLTEMDTENKPQGTQLAPISSNEPDMELGQEQLSLLDVVAVFLAKHDEQPAFTQRLFLLLNQLKTASQKCVH
jgi:prefoldin subunit 5